MIVWLCGIQGFFMTCSQLYMIYQGMVLLNYNLKMKTNWQEQSDK